MNLFAESWKEQENSFDTEVRKVSLSPVELLEAYNSSFVDHSRGGAFQISSCVSQRGGEHASIDLLNRIKHQDRDALRQFYDLYATRVGSFLLKQLKNPDLVDEAVNDVMLTIWQHAGDYDPAKGKFTTWLFGITHNKGLKIRERARRFAVEEPLEVNVAEGREHVEPEWEQHDLAQTPEQTILAWELLDALNDALDSLSLEHREILELSYSGENSYQDIADLLNCPANTVKTRVFHARKKLFERLQRKGYTPTALQGRWL